jgi:hypothetical protein
MPIAFAELEPFAFALSVDHDLSAGDVDYGAICRICFPL